MLALDYNTYGEIGLVLVTVVMTGFVLITLLRRDRAHLERARRLPLDPDALDGEARSES